MHFPGTAPAVSVVAIKSSQDRRGSNARCFGKPPSTREASPVPAGEMHNRAGSWRGAWAPFRGCSQGTSARDHLSSASLAWGAHPMAPFALGWVQAVDATAFIPVKNSLEGRRRGGDAEVFALSVSTLLGMVMLWWQRREGRGI